MEWLEFDRWSPEVEWALALQVARVVATRPSSQPTPRMDTRALASHLQSLLRTYPPTNPWGHPPGEV
ncbi:MAG: hypothetical protein L0Y66_11855 [Myxococcaceae bacterium]|nr:hypothetical protein [Myxococcaceae bacterium]MCI0671052.1 hypothetical protein [Myxococcaceae bacterium]